MIEPALKCADCDEAADLLVQGRCIECLKFNTSAAERALVVEHLRTRAAAIRGTPHDAVLVLEQEATTIESLGHHAADLSESDVCANCGGEGCPAC